MVVEAELAAQALKVECPTCHKPAGKRCWSTWEELPLSKTHHRRVQRMKKNMENFVITNDFRHELRQLINKHSQEGGSNTPDSLLADYLVEHLNIWNKTIARREQWFGRPSPVKHNPFTNKEIASER